MQTHRVKAILIGESLSKTGRILVASFAAMGALYLLLSHTGSLGDSIDRWLGTNYTLLTLCLILVALGAMTAVSNNGVVLSIVVVAVPLAGYFLSGNIAFARTPTLLARATYIVQE